MENLVKEMWEILKKYQLTVFVVVIGVLVVGDPAAVTLLNPVPAARAARIINPHAPIQLQPIMVPTPDVVQKVGLMRRRTSVGNKGWRQVLAYLSRPRQWAI